MNFKENITLKQYSDEANRQFGDFRKQLQTLETDFDAKMGGKTLAETIGSMVGTGLWVAFILGGSILLVIYREYYRYYYGIEINIPLLIVAVIIFLILFTLIFIDEYTDYSFCKKIVDYQNAIVNLEKKLVSGNNSIQENSKAFAYAETLGFNYTLTKATSMQEEAGNIGAKVRGMTSLKEGFITEAKEIMYYVATGGVTLFGLVSLFGGGMRAAHSTFEAIDFFYLDTEAYVIGVVVAILAVIVGEVLLTRFAWSKMDCKVTNTTVFAAFAGVAIFVPLCMLFIVVIYYGVLLLIGAFYVAIIGLMSYCFSQL